MKQKTIVNVIQFLFIILFLYTGISKLMDYTVFKEQIATSPLLAGIAPAMAWLLPATEIAIATMLFIPRWKVRGLQASLILMILFTLYIVFMLSFNKNIPCSCGGVIELLSWKDHLVFNGVFIVLAILGMILEKRIGRIRNDISTSFITQ